MNDLTRQYTQQQLDDAEQRGYLNGYHIGRNPWWQRLIGRMFGPPPPEPAQPLGLMDVLAERKRQRLADAARSAETAPPRPSTSSPPTEPVDRALALLVERVLYATNGFGLLRADVEMIVHEAFWQCGHLIRQGHTVEIPEIGLFKRRPASGAPREILFAADPGLLGVNDD